VTQEGIATALGVSQQAVSSWVNGGAKPSYQRRLRLQELYGVPLESWDEKPSESTGPEVAA